MPKFEVDMEIQGFKLRIRGDRNEDFADLSNQIGRHVAGALLPPAAVIEGEGRKRVESASTPTGQGDGNDNRSKGPRRRRAPGGAASTPSVVNWTHDPAKWGMPKQAWTLGNKVLWLLYVIKNETSRSQLSSGEIARTWNARFKQFGLLKKSSMTTLMSSLKTSEPVLAMDDTTKAPIEWFLTDEGGKAAERLVQEAKTAPTTTS